MEILYEPFIPYYIIETIITLVLTCIFINSSAFVISFLHPQIDNSIIISMVMILLLILDHMKLLIPIFTITALISYLSKSYVLISVIALLALSNYLIHYATMLTNGHCVAIGITLMEFWSISMLDKFANRYAHIIIGFL